MTHGRKTGGRKAGTPNKATVEQSGSLTELARAHTDVAINALIDVAKKGQSEAARVSAAIAILDRGYGSPRQAVDDPSSSTANPNVIQWEDFVPKRRQMLAAEEAEEDDQGG